jgi:hypothetical protein
MNQLPMMKIVNPAQVAIRAGMIADRLFPTKSSVVVIGVASSGSS